LECKGARRNNKEQEYFWEEKVKFAVSASVSGIWEGGKRKGGNPLEREKDSGGYSSKRWRGVGREVEEEEEGKARKKSKARTLIASTSCVRGHSTPLVVELYFGGSGRERTYLSGTTEVPAPSTEAKISKTVAAGCQRSKESRRPAAPPMKPGSLTLKKVDSGGDG